MGASPAESSVKITNTFEHYTVMRGGKYVGGRINFLSTVQFH